MAQECLKWTQLCSWFGNLWCFKFHSVVCTVHVYEVIVYKLVQHYAHTQSSYIPTCFGGGHRLREGGYAYIHIYLSVRARTHTHAHARTRTNGLQKRCPSDLFGIWSTWFEYSGYRHFVVIFTSWIILPCLIRPWPSTSKSLPIHLPFITTFLAHSVADIS
jgi:hypothetical protein